MNPLRLDLRVILWERTWQRSGSTDEQAVTGRPRSQARQAAEDHWASALLSVMSATSYSGARGSPRLSESVPERVLAGMTCFRFLSRTVPLTTLTRSARDDLKVTKEI